MKMKKVFCILLVLCLAGLLFAGFRSGLTLTEYSLSAPDVPDGFDGFRIAVVSDLHAERFGSRQSDLIALLRQADCDLVCYTGDLVSFDTADFSPVWELVEGLQDIPAVFVAGNNELLLEGYDLFLTGLEQRGVTVLDDTLQPTLALSRNGDNIIVRGYSFTDSRRLGNRLPLAENDCFNILLYHDPYIFPEAALLDYDLMLSGHIHGGMVRLPLLGSPLEWLELEPYTKGAYTSRASTLIVSGGLGAHGALPRFFNAPEVVVITLKAPGT